MSEQEKMQATAKLRRSRRTQKQNGAQPPPLPLPANDDKEGWEVYWKAQGQPWRTEPEIDTDRQKFLTERRSITPNIEKGFYPFKDIEPKLTRADIEWLLATHENGCGPVDWSDESQRGRKGLDLRGADLSKVDLHDLPLARTQAGLSWIMTTSEWLNTTPEQQEMAKVHLEGANLRGVHLEGANLIKAYLEDAYLIGAYLSEADLTGAYVAAYLIEAHLEDANLTWTHLGGADLGRAYLHRANLRGAFFNSMTNLEDAILGEKKSDSPLLADIRWDGVDLSVVNWTPVNVLGDEREAHRCKISAGKRTRQERVKEEKQRIKKYQTAVRAYRQLATVLRDQGMDEKASRFAYRGQLVRRKVVRQEVFQQDSSWQLRMLRSLDYIFSLLLDVLAGYGHKPQRSLGMYLLVIVGFTIAYSIFGHLPPLPDALVFSFMSFHGRGFFPSLSNETSLHNPVVVLAAVEAVTGLLIEISLIATFTQRFLGR